MYVIIKVQKEREVNTMNRKTMIDNLINKIGFEHPLVIEFVRLCDETEANAKNDDLLYNLYAAIIGLRKLA
jgi:hypothetical protein